MQGGRAHELARSRISIGIEQNSPAKPQVGSRPVILSEHPPTLSFEANTSTPPDAKPAFFSPGTAGWVQRLWEGFNESDYLQLDAIMRAGRACEMDRFLHKKKFTSEAMTFMAIAQ